jgi:hypothetical protein
VVVGQKETGINVRCKVNWASPLPLIAKARIAIDGRSPELRSWGTHFFPTSPGTHEVSVSFHWRGGPDPEARTTVEVPAGEQIYVEFRTPLMLGLAFIEKPVLRVVSPPPT